MRKDTGEQVGDNRLEIAERCILGSQGGTRPSESVQRSAKKSKEKSRKGARQQRGARHDEGPRVDNAKNRLISSEDWGDGCNDAPGILPPRKDVHVVKDSYLDESLLPPLSESDSDSEDSPDVAVVE